MEIYHHGMFREMHNLIEKNLLTKPYYVNFVMGMAYQGAVDRHTDESDYPHQLMPQDTMFNCCAMGASQLPITTMSALIGGQVRVGMEDNIYYSRGVLARITPSLSQRVSKSSAIWF